MHLWTLATDTDHEGLAVTLHGSYEAAYLALRDAFLPDLDEEASIEEIEAALMELDEPVRFALQDHTLNVEVELNWGNDEAGIELS